MVKNRKVIVSHKVRKRINFCFTFFVFYGNTFCIYMRNNSSFFSKYESSSVASCHSVHTSRYEWGFRQYARYSLFLHITSHECPVRIIVFEEWNCRSSDRKCLVCSDVNKIYFIFFNQSWFCLHSSFNFFFSDISVFVIRNTRVSDVEIFFFKSVHIHKLFCHLSVFYFYIRSFDDSKRIDLCVCRKVKNKTDVWSFRSMNRANTSVVRSVHVADFKTCSFSSKSSGPKSGKNTKVLDFGQDIFLVHKLRKLVRRKKFFYASLKRTLV